VSRIYANKTDENHAEIRDAVRAAMPDASVQDMSGSGGGFPDLCIGWRGFNFLVEIKRKKGGRLTNAQVGFHQNWQGQVAVCSTPAEVVASMLRAVHPRK